MDKIRVTKRSSDYPNIGDFRRQIGLYQRDIDAPAFGSADFDELYTLVKNVWAKLESFLGDKIFDDVSQSKRITDVFTIRFRTDITTENIVKISDDYFEIVNVHDPNKRKRFLELRCTLLGDSSFAANQ